MSLCTLDSEDLFDWVKAQHRIAKSVSNMGEFLSVSPLDLVLVSAIVVVVSCSRSVFLVLLPVFMLGLREHSSGGLTPPVVMLEELIVQVVIDVFTGRELVKA